MTSRDRGFIVRLALLLAAVALVSCLEGGGSDQPNRIAGRLRGPEGKPATDAVVRLYRGAYHMSLDQDLEPSGAVLIAETHSDAGGGFHFPDPGQGAYYLEARSGDSAAIALKDSVGREGRGPDAGTLMLQKRAVIKGKVIRSGVVKSFHLAGTHFSIKPDTSGAFSFNSLPAGPALLVARMGDAANEGYIRVRALQLAAGQVMDLDTFSLARDSLPPNPDTTSRIPLWDFETPDRRNLLRGILFPDSLPIGDMTGSWDPYRTFGIWPDAPYRGRFCMNMNLEPGEQGFFLAKGYLNLGKLQELSFFAKGNGKVYVKFRTGIAKTGMGTFQALITLTPEWSRYSVKPEDILAPAGTGLAQNGLTFEMAKTQVAGIFFAPQGPVSDFYLDDIEVVGPTLSDL